MKNLKLFLGILFLFVGNRTIAQNDLFIDQYIFHQQIFNPAAIGQNTDFGVFLYGDRNFNNTTNHQYKYLISGYKSFKNNDLDIGLSFIQNKIFKEKSTYLLGDITYGFKIDSLSVLKFGVKSGILNYNNPLTEYQLYPDGQYDPAFVNDVNDNYFLVGLGVYYSSKRFTAGISSPQIALIKTKDNSGHQVNKNFELYMFSGYEIWLKEKLLLEPNILIQYIKGLQVTSIAAIFLKYDERLSLGASYDFRNYSNIFARWVLENGIGIGYSYNFKPNTSYSNLFNKHSLSISYDLKKSNNLN